MLAGALELDKFSGMIWATENGYAIWNVEC